ncbi:hypothetical protein M378DRAFT_182326 [Amanita muscaria Koide BX008]|uniref:Protein-S-isoprenylcysteine O-methyltransferase n=1 Tax=Amanita muscaria (strain Koide BX008) TaxID=946122 RepID=A0A0C2SM94_AMAMK|nr:hypothetical protein M378DRAFT_182326 [Amanita muscaria Koide BX008]
MPSLIKLPFLFLYALAIYFANNRTYQSVPEKERPVKGFRELIIPRIRLITELLTVATVAIEATLLIKQYHSLPANETGPLYVTPLSVLGCIMAMIAGYIRHRAIATMGPMFTLAVTIQDNHKLITHGPYGVVRHPAYTGAVIGLTGSVLYNFGPGSIMQAVITWSPIMPYFQAILFASLVWVGIVMSLRSGVEDKLLKQQFGKEWENWAKKTPYRLFPYVY